MLCDHWMGRILEAFASRDWLDELLVVFWSDHGEMAGDHGRFYNSTFHESSVRVPLVLRWPGRIPAGKTAEALAENIDVFPTLLEAVGADPSRRAQGRSLWPVLEDPQAELREVQLSEIAHALQTGTPVIGLGTWSLSLHGQQDNSVIRARNPEEAVKKAIAAAKTRERGRKAIDDEDEVRSY